MKTAYMTTLCNGDAYLPGVQALGRSLSRAGAAHEKVVMVTEDVSETACDALRAEGWLTRLVAPIENPNPKAQQMFERFASTFTKLRVWEQVDYDKIVYLDADTIVLRNIDELFDRPSFAAAPDFFLPDRFNSGVMVLKPALDVFESMTKALFTAQSYDGGDQGFLNSFMADWYALPVAHRLPAGYNLQHFIYQFLRGHRAVAEQIEHEARIVHYSVQKPWLSKPTLTGGSEAWWDAFYANQPESDVAWKHRLHAAEDWSFDKLAQVLLG